MLEVRSRARQPPERRRIKRTPFAGKEEQAEKAAPDLEAARANVSVGDAITCEVKDRPHEQRRES
jgi:hypothetical protein